MHEQPAAYGLWPLVVINTAVFLIFAFSFTRPRTGRDWRSFSTFAAFIVALFTEMYGFPLTLYLLSGWLGNRYPGLNPYSHNAGHIWETLFGWRGDPHLNPLHILSNLLIAAGFILLASAWNVLYRAQRTHTLATCPSSCPSLHALGARSAWPDSPSATYSVQFARGCTQCFACSGIQISPRASG